MKVVAVSITEIDDIIDAGHVGDQPVEYRIAFDNDARLFFCDERRVPDKLERVAEALLAPKQDRLAGKVFIAPHRTLEIGEIAITRFL